MVETKGAHGRSLAFESRGGKLRVLLEEAVPTVKVRGVTYYATEAPSVTVNGKKHFVEEVC
jgi:hypothetical protein